MSTNGKRVPGQWFLVRLVFGEKKTIFIKYYFFPKKQQPTTTTTVVKERERKSLICGYIDTHAFKYTETPNSSSKKTNPTHTKKYDIILVFFFVMPYERYHKFKIHLKYRVKVHMFWFRKPEIVGFFFSSTFG